MNKTSQHLWVFVNVWTIAGYTYVWHRQRVSKTVCVCVCACVCAAVVNLNKKHLNRFNKRILQTAMNPSMWAEAWTRLHVPRDNHLRSIMKFQIKGGKQRQMN